MKTNYHTHTYRCKHAMGNDERIVLNAIKADFDILGFSDHTPWPHFPADYDSHVRMEPQLRQRKPPAGKIQGPDRDSPRPGGGVLPAPYAGAS